MYIYALSVLGIILVLSLLAEVLCSLAVYRKLRNTGVKAQFSFLSVPFYLHGVGIRNNETIPNDISQLIKLVTRLQVVIIVGAPILVVLILTFSQGSK
jgi:hypothetical protein